MRRSLIAFFIVAACVTALSALVLLPGCGARTSARCDAYSCDPLPSWNDTPTRRAITDFVRRVTARGSPEFVAPAERIAVFDNDGTLWCEQPEYPQVAFMIDRVRALVPRNPGWSTTEPFKSMIAGDAAAALSSGPDAFLDILRATHGGMTTDEYRALSKEWIAHSLNARRGVAHTQLVYQPMLELLAYLRANGFKTFIVSGGDTEFMRVFAEELYGVPPEQVIGTSMRMDYQVGDDGPVIHRRNEREYGNDRAEKVVSIQRHIGRRPIAAFGNSDGDFAMIEWTTAGPGARLGAFIHHTDAEREWAYDRGSRIGKLEKGLDAAAGRGWVVVDMKLDWRVVFP